MIIVRDPWSFCQVMYIEHWVNANCGFEWLGKLHVNFDSLTNSTKNHGYMVYLPIKSGARALIKTIFLTVNISTCESVPKLWRVVEFLVIMFLHGFHWIFIFEKNKHTGFLFDSSRMHFAFSGEQCLKDRNQSLDSKVLKFYFLWNVFLSRTHLSQAQIHFFLPRLPILNQWIIIFWIICYTGH